MADLEQKRFESPDETRTFNDGMGHADSSASAGRRSGAACSSRAGAGRPT